LKERLNMPSQTYENHRHTPRLTGIGFLCVLLATAGFVARWFGVETRATMAIGLGGLIAADVVLLLISREYITKLQDRIIKLEMRLRFSERLTPPQQAIVARLPTSSIVALRFASDDELPALVDRADRERLTPDQIKRAIRTWVPDWDRT
jgi:hypothetical protein